MTLTQALEIVKEMAYELRRQASVEVTMTVHQVGEKYTTKTFKAAETERRAQALELLYDQVRIARLRDVDAQRTEADRDFH